MQVQVIVLVCRDAKVQQRYRGCSEQVQRCRGAEVQVQGAVIVQVQSREQEVQRSRREGGGADAKLLKRC